MSKNLVNLSDTQEVKEFVNIISKFPFDADLVSGRYVINAKSIMGIFSLDLSQPIELVLHTDDASAIDELLSEIKAFIK